MVTSPAGCWTAVSHWVNPSHDGPSVPTRPLLHGWAVIHSTVLAPSAPSCTARSCVPPDPPVPRRSWNTRTYPSESTSWSNTRMNGRLLPYPLRTSKVGHGPSPSGTTTSVASRVPSDTSTSTSVRACFVLLPGCVVRVAGLLRGVAGVDGQRRPGDVAALVGRQEQQCVRDVDRLDVGDREGVDPQVHRVELLAGRVFDIGEEQLVD